MDFRELLNLAAAKRDAAKAAADAEYAEAVRSIEIVRKLAGASPAVAVAERAPRKAQPPKSSATNREKSYLGEFRRVIGILPEPFTKDDVRQMVSADNPEWDAHAIQTNLHNAFAFLFAKNYIAEDPTQDRTALGPGRWIRTENYSSNSDAARNQVPVFEPATGKRWTSVQELVKEIGTDQPHRVYRAIADAKPLDDGRLIKYVNGHGQRKAGEPPHGSVKADARTAQEAAENARVFPRAADRGTVEPICA